MSVKALRDATSMSIALCAQAWRDSGEDLTRALELLKDKGADKAARLQDRTTKAGFIGLYRHHDGMTIGMVQLLCETDFVSKTAAFRNLADNMAMHVASLSDGLPEIKNELLAQELITGHSGLTIQQEIDALSAKVGEKISLGSVTHGKI